MSADQLRVAYCQAHAAVDYLWRNFGQVRLRQFVDHLAAGSTAEEALVAVYRRSYSMFERDVAGRVTGP